MGATLDANFLFFASATNKIDFNTFLAKALEFAPHINFTHCIIHTENLASKTLDPDLKSVLDTAIKIVNFIKLRPLQTRLFATLYGEMGSHHKSFLLHSDVRMMVIEEKSSYPYPFVRAAGCFS